MLNPYEALANAVVKQAVDDWRSSARRLLKKENDADRRLLNNAEKFFNDPFWFGRFSDLDGKLLLEKLMQEHETITVKEVYLEQAALLAARIKRKAGKPAAEAMEKQLATLKRQMRSSICRMKDAAMRQLLISRYVDCQRTSDLARKMKISDDEMPRRLRAALSSFVVPRKAIRI